MGVTGPKPKTNIERFMKYANAVSPEACWLWSGSVRSSGHGFVYGVFTVRYGRRDFKSMRIHRFTFEHFIAPIPDGLVIDHLCRNTLCCNPLHLEAVTQKENSLRGISPMAKNARKTHCPQGHPYATHAKVAKNGRKQCWPCHKAAKLRWYYDQKQLKAQRKAALPTREETS